MSGPVRPGCARPTLLPGCAPSPFPSYAQRIRNSERRPPTTTARICEHWRLPTRRDQAPAELQVSHTILPQPTAFASSIGDDSLWMLRARHPAVGIADPQLGKPDPPGAGRGHTAPTQTVLSQSASSRFSPTSGDPGKSLWRSRASAPLRALCVEIVSPSLTLRRQASAAANAAKRRPAAENPSQACGARGRRPGLRPKQCSAGEACAARARRRRSAASEKIRGNAKSFY